MDNERRADIGHAAVHHGAAITNVHTQEDTTTAIKDVLAYIAHFCQRCGLVPDEVFDNALRSYYGDFEDGPEVQALLDAELPLVDHGPVWVRSHHSS
jgi:hypothetical protein